MMMFGGGSILMWLIVGMGILLFLSMLSNFNKNSHSVEQLQREIETLKKENTELKRQLQEERMKDTQKIDWHNF